MFHIRYNLLLWSDERIADGRRQAMSGIYDEKVTVNYSLILWYLEPAYHKQLCFSDIIMKSFRCSGMPPNQCHDNS